MKDSFFGVGLLLAFGGLVVYPFFYDLDITNPRYYAQLAVSLLGGSYILVVENKQYVLNYLLRLKEAVDNAQPKPQPEPEPEPETPEEAK